MDLTATEGQKMSIMSLCVLSRTSKVKQVSMTTERSLSILSGRSATLERWTEGENPRIRANQLRRQLEGYRIFKLALKHIA